MRTCNILTEKWVYARPEATIDQITEAGTAKGLAIIRSAAMTIRADLLYGLLALFKLGAGEWPRKK